MKLSKSFLLLSAVFLFETASATDIVTLSGKTYRDVHDIMIRGDRLTFTTATDIVRLPLSDISPALRERYKPKATPPPVESPPPPPAATSTAKLPTTPHELVLSVANRTIQQIASNMKALPASGPVTFTPENAFSVEKIEDARKDALANGRALGFFIVSEAFYKTPADPNKLDAIGGFARFFQSFKGSVTPVFILPARDLGKLPAAVTEMLQNPVTVAVPRVVFTNAEITKPLFDLALPGEKATLRQRDEAIYAAVVAIKRWYIDIANATH